MTQPNDPRKVKVIVELIDHTIKIAEAQDRGDLAGRMAKAKERISDPQIRVVIAGQLKQGKSQLLNSLLNVPVSRVGDDESTVVATMVSYGEQATAKLILAGDDGAEPAAIEIPIADIKNDLRRHPAAGGRQVLRVAVTANSPLLKGGLVFVDTPGVGGHGQPHLSATLGLLPDADAMLMISDTSQEFTDPEMTFIRQAFEICPVAMIVATKTGASLDGSPGLAPARLEREVENALRRLQTDTIDLYFAHFPDPKTPVEESLGAFDRLVKAGKVKAIGASNHTVEQLREALDSSRQNGLAEYSVFQPHYSLVQRGIYEGPLRDLCRDEGLGVIAYFALASGFLTGKYRSEADSVDKARQPYVAEFLTPRNFRILEVVEDVARETGAGNVAVALAWLMAQPTVTAPIASATRTGHVEQMLAGLELTLSADQLARLDDVSTLALAADGGA